MRTKLWLVFLLLPGLMLVSCDDDDNGPTETGDTTPPAGVTDLMVTDITENTATLAWTAPGDDGNDGTASRYDIRFSRNPISNANFAAAATAPSPPTPGAAGSGQTYTLTGLMSSTIYYFALKTADEVPNWSVLSNTVVDTTLGDLSLILSGSRVGKYVIVLPETGQDSVEVTPAVHFLGPKKLGFHSKRVFVVSPTGPGQATNVIYGCDTFTGANLQQITNDDVNVLSLDGSPAEEKLVYAGWDVEEFIHDIHVINEDGTGHQQLTVQEEPISLPDGSAAKLIAAGDPSWSPDGSKIAFMAGLREVPSNFAHDAIVVMDSDGQNKQALYERPVEEAHYRDVCWTSDGEFVVFSVEDGGRKVRAVHVASGTLSDITAALVTDTGIEALWTSPYGMELVFHLRLTSGDLYTAQLRATGSSLSVQGSRLELTDWQAVGHTYTDPDWAPWVRW